MYELPVVNWLALIFFTHPDEDWTWCCCWLKRVQVHCWRRRLILAEKDDLLLIWLCFVFVVIKSECFIEWRLSPHFLLSSTKSAVCWNAGPELMLLMKARCGLPKRAHFLSLKKLGVTVILNKPTDWRTVVHHQIPLWLLVVHTVLAKTNLGLEAIHYFNAACVSILFSIPGFNFFTKNLSILEDYCKVTRIHPSLYQNRG